MELAEFLEAMIGCHDLVDHQRRKTYSIEQ
jgi:hypothetical protein